MFSCWFRFFEFRQDCAGNISVIGSDESMKAVLQSTYSKYSGNVVYIEHPYRVPFSNLRKIDPNTKLGCGWIIDWFRLNWHELFIGMIQRKLISSLFLFQREQRGSSLTYKQASTHTHTYTEMDNFICGGYIFSSNFDSGNLHKVELVKWNEGTIDSTCPFHVPLRNQTQFGN